MAKTTEENVKPSRIKSALASIDKQVPNLTYFGLAFWMVWNTIAFSGAFWLFDTDNSLRAEELSMYHLIASVVTMILVAAFSNKLKHLVCRNRVTITAAVLATLGTLVVVGLRDDFLTMMFGTSDIGPIVMYLFNGSSIVTGASTTLLFMRAVPMFSALPPRKALTRFAACYLLSSAVFFVAAGMGSNVGCVIFVLLPLMSGLLLSLRPPAADEHVVLHTQGKVKPDFLVFLISIVLISTVLSMMQSYVLIGTPAVSNISVHAWSQFMCIIAMLVLILIALFIKDRGKGIIGLYSAVTVIVTIIVMASISFDAKSQLIAAFSATAVPTYNVIVWSMLAYIVYQSQAEALKVLNFGNAALALGTVISAFITIAYHNGYIDSDTMRIVLVVFGFLVLLDVALVFNDKRLHSVIVPIDEKRLEPDVFGAMEDKPRKWEMNLDGIADKYALTKREREMFLAVAKGKTVQQIADAETLSVYTVRAHIRNMYTKLDVHSKSELQDLINRELQG